MDENEFDFENRIMSSSYDPHENENENTLRPQTLDEYIGQEKAKANLKIIMEAAKLRGEQIEPCASLRTSRTRQDHPFRYHSRRNGSESQNNLRSVPSRKRETLSLCLRDFRRGTCCSSTRYTACRGLWRKYSTPRWRTTLLT